MHDLKLVYFKIKLHFSGLIENNNNNNRRIKSNKNTSTGCYKRQYVTKANDPNNERENN